MVAEHHVGDVPRGDPERGERVEQRLPARHHAGVDHQDALTVPHQAHGARDALAGVPGEEHVEPSRAGQVGGAHRAVQPLSIDTALPVNARPDGPSRKAAVSATSAGSIIRLTACGASSTSSRTCSSVSPCACA